MDYQLPRVYGLQLSVSQFAVCSLILEQMLSYHLELNHPLLFPSCIFVLFLPSTPTLSDKVGFVLLTQNKASVLYLLSFVAIHNILMKPGLVELNQKPETTGG